MPDLYDKDGEPIKEVFDIDGNPLEETLTPDEVDTKIQEAKEESKAEHNTLNDKLQEAQDALKEKEEELVKEQEKDKNFGKFREKGKEKNGEIATLTETVKNLGEKIDKQGVAGKERSLQAEINRIVGTDEELGKKVKFFYDKFAGEPETDEQFKERLTNAFTLASGSATDNPLAGAAASSGAGTVPGTEPDKKGKISEEGKGFAKELGITDKELKKDKLI